MKKGLIFLLFTLIWVSLLLTADYAAKTENKYVILIRWGTRGFQQHTITKLEDFFNLNYPADSRKFNSFHFVKGGYILGKSETGRLYMIEECSKIAGKNEWLIILRPYITPDPRSIYRKK